MPCAQLWIYFTLFLVPGLDLLHHLEKKEKLFTLLPGEYHAEVILMICKSHHLQGQEFPQIWGWWIHQPILPSSQLASLALYIFIFALGISNLRR